MAKNLKLKKPIEYCWVIAYINSDYIDRVHSDLAKHKVMMDIEAYIPTIKILKKQHKNKSHYESIPLLFNYGFFKIPRDKAVKPAFLDYMKDRVSCIIGYVKDSTAVMKNPQVKVNTSMRTRMNGYAIATEQEIANLLEMQNNLTIHSTDEIQSLYPGKVITLKGYPFDDLEAEVIKVQANNVLVKLLSGDLLKKVTVSFDNIFYTVYKNSQINHDSKTKSLEELSNRTLNRLGNISINIDHDLK